MKSLLSRLSSSVRSGRPRVTRCATLGTVLALIAGCAPAPDPIPAAMTKPPAPLAPYSATEALKEFDSEQDTEYRLGSGDAITVHVWDRTDLSGSQIVGPDGAITVPTAGTLKVAGMTRGEATKALQDELTKLYAKIVVSVRVDRYASNRVVVLGQVRLPGVLQFDAMPTLLEALARAGGLISADATTNLTHCAIIRGRDRVAWIDLRSIFQSANLARSEEHTSELQSQSNLVCRLLLEK